MCPAITGALSISPSVCPFLFAFEVLCYLKLSYLLSEQTCPCDVMSLFIADNTPCSEVCFV